MLTLFFLEWDLVIIVLRMNIFWELRLTKRLALESLLEQPLYKFWVLEAISKTTKKESARATPF